MRLSKTIALTIANAGLAFNLFGGSRSQGGIIDPTRPTVPAEDSHPLLRRSELYSKAMLELKRLEDEPLCHRLAAQLLMNTCRGLQDVNEETLHVTKTRMQRNHVESFAAALAICDMEDVKMPVPTSCRSLSSAALFEAVRDEKDTLVVPAETVTACLTSLSEQEKPWMTWLSRRDTALLFCRASSIDMDNDQLFQLHKKLVQMMAGFAIGLEHELKGLRANMHAQSREVDFYFESFKTYLDLMKTRVQTSFEGVSKDVKDIASSLGSMKQSGLDLQQFLQALFKTALEGKVEMAAVQEQALSTLTNSIQTQSHGLNEIVEKNQNFAVYMSSFMEDLLANMEAASEHHNIMSKNAQQMTHVLANATELFLEHSYKIEQASEMIDRIHANLGPVAAAGDFISGYLRYDISLWDLAIRVATPPGLVFLGSHGLPASIIRNTLLGFGGLPVGELIVRLRHLEWPMQWRCEHLMPSWWSERDRKHARQSTFGTTAKNQSYTSSEDPEFDPAPFEIL